MYFEPHEKLIYFHPDYPEERHDPLWLNHLLTIHSGGRFDTLLILRNAPHDNLGDVSPAGKQKAAVEAAQAELELVGIAKKAFNLPQETMAAEVLERLYYFIHWLEGKGNPAGKPQTSPSTLGSTPSETTPTTLDSSSTESVVASVG